MPQSKEIAYFDYKYQKGISWYKNKFDGHNGEKAIGEATPWYMCDDRADLATERMGSTIPDARLIFILRDPVYRAYSNFWDDFRNSDGPIRFTTAFSDFIREEKNRSHTIIKCGYYYKHLRRFEEHFDRDQFLILLHEDLRNVPVKTVQRVYDFLGVDPSFVPDTSTKTRVTNGFRYLDTLRTVNRIFFPIEKSLGGTPLTWLWDRLPHFRYLFWQSGERPPSMSDKDRRYLQRLYAEPNKELSTYLDRDLSHWEGMNEHR